MQRHEPSRKQQSRSSSFSPASGCGTRPAPRKHLSQGSKKPWLTEETVLNVSWQNIYTDLLHYGRIHRLLKLQPYAVSIWVVYLRTAVQNSLDLSGSTHKTEITMTHLVLEEKQVIKYKKIPLFSGDSDAQLFIWPRLELLSVLLPYLILNDYQKGALWSDIFKI